MKRINIFILAAAALLSAACAKELSEKEITQEQEEQIVATDIVTITAGLEPISKVALSQGTDCVKTSWEAGDQIKVEDEVFDIVSGIGTQSASFSGSAPAGSGPYTVAIVPKAARMSAQSQTGDSNPSGQPYYAVLSGVSDYSSVIFSQEWADANSATFSSTSLIKLYLKLPAGVTGISEVRLNAPSDVFVNPADVSSTISEISTSVTSLDASSSSQIVNLYLAVVNDAAIAAGAELTVSVVTESGSTYVKHFTPGEKALAGAKVFVLQINDSGWNEMSGSGVETAPFIINSVEDMQDISSLLVQNGPVRYFKLGVANLDMSGTKWVPILTSDVNKRIDFDGDGKTISNLTNGDLTDKYASFAGFLNGTIKNVTFSGANFTNNTGAEDYIAVVAGHAGNNSYAATITAVTVTDSSLDGGAYKSNTGFIAGRAENVTVSSCNVNGTSSIDMDGIASNDVATGALIGYLRGSKTSTISDCSTDATVNVAHGRNIGGFIGQIGSGTPAVIYGCTSNGTVTGTENYVGGFIGIIGGANGTIGGDTNAKKCQSNVTVNAATLSGGFAGAITGSGYTLEKCYSTGQITGANPAGGFIGGISGAATISDCHSTSTVVGAQTTAGFVGRIWSDSATGSFTGCDWEGTFTGNGYRNAGFAAVIESSAAYTFSGCHAAGTIVCSSTHNTNGSRVGGFAGFVAAPTTFTDCYWEGNPSKGNSSLTEYQLQARGALVGGFAGYQTAECTYTGCYSTGGIQLSNVITATSDYKNMAYFGGLIGSIDAKATVSKCHSTASLYNSNSNASFTGGLVGYITNNAGSTRIEKSYYNGAILSARSSNAGGFIGGGPKSATASVSVENCWSSGSINTFNNRVGGFIGVPQSNWTISDCYSSMSMVCEHNFAGFVGSEDGGANNGTTTNITLSKCIAWNPSIVSVRSGNTGALAMNANNFGAGAVVSFAMREGNIHTSCIRRPDMTFTCMTTIGGVDYNALYDQEDSDEMTPLSWPAAYNTYYDKGDFTYCWYAPYHGKAAAAGKSLSEVADELGWDSDIWDLSGSTPVLK